MNFFRQLKELFKPAQPVVEGPSAGDLYDKMRADRFRPTKMNLIYDLDYAAKKATVIDLKHPGVVYSADLDDEILEVLAVDPEARQVLEKATIDEFKNVHKQFYEGIEADV